MLLQISVPTPPPVPPLPPMPTPDVVLQGPFFPPPWVTLPAPVIVLSTFAICAALAVVLFPLFRAIGRRIEGRGQQDAALQQEVDELRERVRDLEAAQGRFAELEERLDFAERLLARKREAEQLPRN